ncbi:MAG: energy transducer TonB [Ferruginibacter sp.]
MKQIFSFAILLLVAKAGFCQTSKTSDNTNPTVVVPVRVNDEEKVFTKVEVEAKFPGENGSWATYLRKNLYANIPSDKGCDPGTYTVIIRFIVSKTGKVSDVTAETNFGYGMEAEAMRLIKKGPDWIPAHQNGYIVNAYRRQPITFVVE